MTSLDLQEQSEKSGWDLLQDQVSAQMDTSQQELREISMLLKQSQVEVEKLTQRNASITSRLQHVQAQLDTLPREDIREAYDEALDAQQRLVVMRGQVEKLESDKQRIERHLEILRSVREAFEGGPPPDTTNGKGPLPTAEMMVQAQEAERQRLSRKMHDGPAQALSNFILLTEIAMRLFDVDQDQAREELMNLKASANSTFQRVRDFIFDLRPMMLDDLGLVPTIKRYSDAFREKSGLDVSVEVIGTERRLKSYLEVMLFRAVQELLNNAKMHGQGTQVNVHIELLESEVRIRVEDDGRGMDIEELSESPGLGLQLIRERVELLGGHFEIDSDPGEGMHVSFSVPVGEPTSFA